MQKRFCKFVHLQLFNLKYKFAHLQLFDVKFLFSGKHTLRKQKRTAVWGRALVFLDFKLTQENDDKLSLRHKWIFEVPHPVHGYTIMRIPNKRYQTNTVRTCWGTRGASALRFLGADHFSRYRKKIYRKQEKLEGKKSQCTWLTRWELDTFSVQGILLATGRIQMSERNEGFKPFREAFIQSNRSNRKAFCYK